MHEMVILMNPPECEHITFRNLNIIASFHSHIFRKDVQTCAAHISTKSTPHHYTSRVLYSFNCKFRVKPRNGTWAAHHLWDSLYQPESSLATEHHFSAFCSRPILIFFAKTEPFFLHCRSEHGLLGCTATR